MRPNPNQLAFHGVTRGLYKTADGFVRGARHNGRRRAEIRIVRMMFPERSAWRRAVETACKVHGVDFEGRYSINEINR